MNWLDTVHVGDCRQLLRAMHADGQRVRMAVTSPPYYGLRDYGVAGQLGLELSIGEWVANMVEVFDAVRDVLADDGTLWLNLGDAYASSGGSGHQGKHGYRAGRAHTQKNILGNTARAARVKPKELMGQPWRVAFALQDAGWYLRQEIIWHKPNAMPESAKDRPTTAHERIFLFSKSRRYYYDAAAIAEPVTGNAHARGSGVNPKAKKISGWAEGAGVPHDAVNHTRATRSRQNSSFSASISKYAKGPADAAGGNLFNSTRVARLHGGPHDSPFGDTRNSRSVWTFPTEPFPGAHFATFPRELPRRCILAGSKPGDVVLDPFMGSGTTAEVAQLLGRQWVGMELNPDSAAMLKTLRSSQRGLGI